MRRDNNPQTNFLGCCPRNHVVDCVHKKRLVRTLDESRTHTLCSASHVHHQRQYHCRLSFLVLSESEQIQWTISAGRAQCWRACFHCLTRLRFTRALSGPTYTFVPRLGDHDLVCIPDVQPNPGCPSKTTAIWPKQCKGEVASALRPVQKIVEQTLASKWPR